MIKKFILCLIRFLKKLFDIKDDECNEEGNTEQERPSWRVYVSGFHDWPKTPDDAQNFNQWQCMENPSGRLFFQDWYRGTTKPDADNGPLPDRLSEITQTNDGRTIGWDFDTLPVLWGIARTIQARNYDVVVNLGYGIFRDRTTIYVERGALNIRGGIPDSAGVQPGRANTPGTSIDPDSGRTQDGPDHVNDRVDNVAGDITVGSTTFNVQVMRARESNNYVCNETHYIMLSQAQPDRRLRRAYFIHIPKPEDGGYTDLAIALRQIIETLIQP